MEGRKENLVPQPRATREGEQVEEQLHEGLSHLGDDRVLPTVVQFLRRDLSEGRVELGRLRSEESGWATVGIDEQRAQLGGWIDSSSISRQKCIWLSNLAGSTIYVGYVGEH